MYPSFIIISNLEGKIAFYKNYRNISHNIIEDCSNFIPHIQKNQSQHNYCEYLDFRLIYLPLSDLFLVLGTDINSNIIEDNEIIKKISEILMNILDRNITLDNICDKFEDILIALDETITLTGKDDDLSMLGLENIINMESYNEEQHLKFQNDQEKEIQKKREKEFLEKQKELKTKKNENYEDFKDPMEFYNMNEKEEEEEKPTNNERTGGLNLKKSNKTTIKEKKKINYEIKKEKDFNPLSNSIEVYTKDILCGTLNTGGSVLNFEIKGGLYIKILNPDLTKPIINLSNIKDKLFNVKLPPFLDKNAWKNKKLKLKSSNQNLQINQELNMLRYNISSNNSNCPFFTNIWIQGNEISGDFEFNSVQDLITSLKNVKIIFNNPNNYEIENIENDNCEIESKNEEIIISIKEINKNTDNINFAINFDNNVSEEYLLPGRIEIEDNNSLIGITLNSIENNNNLENKIWYDFKNIISSDNFTIIK